MVTMAKDSPEDYDKNYHRRSNVESAISGKKRKFGNFVRCKNDTAKENEELLGWAVYNFGVLANVSGKPHIICEWDDVTAGNYYTWPQPPMFIYYKK